MHKSYCTKLGKSQNPINKVINKYKIQLKQEKKVIEGVSIITVTNRIENINQVFDNYLRQSIKNKELIVVLNENSMDLEQWKSTAKEYPNVRVYRQDEAITFAECKNFAIGKAKYPYITHFDDDDYYAASFLKDILKTFHKVKADIIGKRSAFVYFENSNILALRLPGSENSFVKFVMDSSMVIKKEVFNEVHFPNLKHSADFIFQKICIEKGLKIYSTDRYNYAFIRHKATDNHVWKISDEELIKECDLITQTDNFIKYITR